MQPIVTEEIIKRAKRENPWWDDPHTIPPPYAEWEPRPYLDLLAPLVENTGIRRAIVLMGPRRVGKTVIIHHEIGRLLKRKVPPQNIAYFSVDHPIYNGMSLERFLAMFEQATGTDVIASKHECYVFFDEIQYLSLIHI